MNLFDLQNIKTVPDVIHEYSAHIKNSQTPLVIDNGK